MAEERVQGLPEALREWVEDRAADSDRSPEEVLARAVSVYQLLDDDGEALPEPGRVPADGDGAALRANPDPNLNADSDSTRDANADAAPLSEETAERLADLEERVADLDADLDEKIEDVRSRVVQVKRETDAKAEADHDHPDLRAAVEAVEGLEAEVEALRADLADLEETVERGFDNYEEVLEYLTDTADDHDAKLTTLATALAETRTRVRRAAATERRRHAADELRTEANRLGVAKASCGECGSTVRLGLLSAPECPHCASAFESLDPASGFFGSATLVVGSRPALEGETVEEMGPEDILAGEDAAGDADRAGAQPREREGGE